MCIKRNNLNVNIPFKFQAYLPSGLRRNASMKKCLRTEAGHPTHKNSSSGLRPAELIKTPNKNISLKVRKRTFGHVRPAKIQISLRIRAVWSESSLGAFWITKDVTFLHADCEDWSSLASVQADLSLRRVHMSDGWFLYLRLIQFHYLVPYLTNESWFDYHLVPDR